MSDQRPLSGHLHHRTKIRLMVFGYFPASQGFNSVAADGGPRTRWAGAEEANNAPGGWKVRPCPELTI